MWLCLSGCRVMQIGSSYLHLMLRPAESLPPPGATTAAASMATLVEEAVVMARVTVLVEWEVKQMSLANEAVNAPTGRFSHDSSM
jgi:hypothetical protein